VAVGPASLIEASLTQEQAQRGRLGRQEAHWPLAPPGERGIREHWAAKPEIMVIFWTLAIKLPKHKEGQLLKSLNICSPNLDFFGLLLLKADSRNQNSMLIISQVRSYYSQLMEERGRPQNSTRLISINAFFYES